MTMFRITMLLMLAAVARGGDTWQDDRDAGAAFLAREEYDRAAEALAAALARAQAVGADAAAVADIAHLLGVAEYSQGKYADAETHLHVALDRLGSEAAHRTTRDELRVDLGAIQTAQGKLDDADLTLCTALAASGEDSLVGAACLGRLAVVAVRRHRYVLAVRLGGLAFAVASRHGHGEEPAVASLLTSVAWLALQLDEPQRAADLVGRAQRALASGGSRQDRIRATAVQVEALSKCGRGEQALTLGRRALAEYVPIVGRDDSDIKELLLAMADTYIDGGHALEAEKQLATIDATKHGRLWMRLCLARARVALLRRDATGARKCALSVVEGPDQSEGSSYVIRAYRLLAEIESARGDQRAAVAYAGRAAEACLRTMGADCPHTRAATAEFNNFRQRAIGAGLAEADLTSLAGQHLGDEIEVGWEQTDEAVRALVARACDRIKAGEWNAAIHDLDEAARARSHEPSIYYHKARALDLSGNSDGALAEADRAVACRSDDPQQYVLRATLWTKRNRPDRTIVDATYAFVLGGRASICLFLRGAAHYGMREYELAESDFGKLAAADPDDHRAVLWHGMALMEVGRLQEAEKRLSEAAEATAFEGDARVALARVYRRRGEPDRALESCARAAVSAPSNADVWWLAALIRCDQEDWRHALDDLQGYEQVGGKRGVRVSLLEWLCIRHTEGRAEAAATLSKAVDGVGRDALAPVAAAILGADADAIDAVVEQCTAGDRCEALFFLGAWREVEGDLAGARELFNRAIATSHTDNDLYHNAVAARARTTRAE